MGKSNKNKKKEDKNKGEYRVGTLGTMIFQSCGVSEPEFDPKLASMFSSNNKSTTVNVGVGVKKSHPVEAMPPPPIRSKINVGINNRKRGGDGLVYTKY